MCCRSDSDLRRACVQDYIAATSPEMAVGEFWTDCNYDEAGKLVYDQDSHRQVRPCRASPPNQPCSHTDSDPDCLQKVTREE